MIGAANLQFATVASREFDKIVGLKDRIIEFEKAQWLIALEPQSDTVLGQHAIDREMPPDIAQQWDVAKFVEPIGVVDHDGIARPIAETQEFCKDRPNPGHVGSDFGIVQQPAGSVLARGVADPRRAAAHQHDRLVPAFLKQAQQHNPEKVAHVQTVRRAVEAVIGYDATGAEALVKRLEIGALMHEAAFGRGDKKG